jgi:hypothetical protein
MKKLPPPSPQTERAYAAIADALGAKLVEQSNMFGMPALKLSGKAFAGLFGDAMVFKLAGDAHAEAVGLAGAELFDPSGMGRPMKAWVVVPKAHAKKWPALAEKALTALDKPAKRAPPAKKTAPRKGR